ncbi:IS3 family transposase [Yersinia sp. KBS0713]|nr:IS3 family transposase [Yersinia sp. KBS0713]
MSRHGNRWDNNHVECFFRSLKLEWAPNCEYDNFSEANRVIMNYIIGYYSQFRVHQYNDVLTPTEPERLYWENAEAVANFS